MSIATLISVCLAVFMFTVLCIAIIAVQDVIEKETKKWKKDYIFKKNTFSFKNKSGLEIVLNNVTTFLFEKEKNIATLEQENGDKYVIDFKERKAKLTSANGEEKVIELEDLEQNMTEGEENSEKIKDR
ncbi:hypothetical protein M2146_002498 [Lachnospiraceae bacterium PF1-22]